MSPISTHKETRENGSDRPHRPLQPGVYVPTVCFFEDETEDLDTQAIGKHAVNLAQAGVTGLAVHGSNGEAVHLSNEERITAIETTRKALDSAGFPNMPLIVGCSAQSTRETIRLCQQAHAAGADYALVLAASYYKALLLPDSVLQFFRDVADASPLPIIIYNYPPAVSGLDLDSDTIIALSEHPNIIGCKFTCGNTGKLNRVAAAQGSTNNSNKSSPAPFLCLGGSGDFTIQTLISGGSGIIGGIANIAPKTCVQVMDLYAQGKLAEARSAQEVLARGDWAAIQGGVVGIKSAMKSHLGYGGFARKPLPRPTESMQESYKREFGELVEYERSL
ncbi:dihydrodipicolinate synthetase [Blastomyces dermatitidis ATCC 18188]|uniref:Dihydrodipicolinate synthetase n=1 Tax=Ajellomyces dermatitidis (strain ATCC 18188 / CBS 674.68) TaxID=653446 RepID=F2T7N5_AJEDA|nr:dihydrodipicolinate synthetase [Blastomyces dermatitidis ATCC 18188]